MNPSAESGTAWTAYLQAHPNVRFAPYIHVLESVYRSGYDSALFRAEMVAIYNKVSENEES